MHKEQLLIPLRFCFVMWGVFSIEYFFGFDLGYLGINPRSISGLVGIIAAPFIHGNSAHLISNTLPILFLGASLFYFYPLVAKQVFLQCYLFTNLLVWILARPFYHIGASGLVYGLASFLVFFGILNRNRLGILVAMVVII
ncbi:MAG: rhomboid family intramembrane serine protease [Bacteroidota bacterium]